MDYAHPKSYASKVPNEAELRYGIAEKKYWICVNGLDLLRLLTTNTNYSVTLANNNSNYVDSNTLASSETIQLYFY